VKKLLKNPTLSDYELGERTDVGRKLAAKARNLVQLREGLDVK
jgi:hypothetical protein